MVVPMKVYISQSKTLNQHDQEPVTITRSLSNLTAMYVTCLGEKPDEDTGVSQMIKLRNGFLQSNG